MIVPGDDWYRRIATMLLACHAAVILLDREALDSRWVKAEARFLALLSAVNDRFPLIPVLFVQAGAALSARARRWAVRPAAGQTG